MRALKISPKLAKRYVTTTDSRHNLPVADNLLQRDFSAESPGQKWVSDITYIATLQGWCYLTCIIDLADRYVVGWAMSNNMSAEATVVAAVRNAVRNRMPRAGFTFHSDRGSQYASRSCAHLISLYDGHQSMPAKGNCYDNAVAESFFKTIKTECINRHEFISMEHAERYVFDYIDGWYNTQRIHTSLNGIAPAQAYRNLTSNALAA